MSRFNRITGRFPAKNSSRGKSKAAECPICGEPVPADSDEQNPNLPFCSSRCREVDFFRWCEGKYAIVEPLSPERLEEEAQRRAEWPEDDEYED